MFDMASQFVCSTSCRGQFVVLLAMISLLTGPVAARAEEESIAQTSKNLDAYFQSYADAGQFSGVALVAANGNIYLEKGYGLASREWGVPNDADTRICIASVSKLFTAHAVMVLVQEGMLDLKKPVGIYLPGLREDIASKVTLHHMLSHSSGIRREIFEDADEYKKTHNSAEILQAINNAPLTFEPGSKTVYSNSEYMLLALIVEKVSGKPFSQALQTLVFEPANMKDTGLADNSRVIKKLASGYDLCVGQPVRAEYSEYTNGIGAGGVYTTVGDLLRFDEALRKNRLLLAEMQAKMRMPQSGPWGYGWRLLKTGQNVDGSPMYAMFHNGDYSGVSAHYMRLPEDKFVFALLSNQDFLPRDALLNGVSSILNGGVASPPKTRLDEQIYQRIVESGPAVGLELYKKLHSSGSRRGLPKAMRCLQTGNMLLRLDRKDDARDVFDFMTRAFPHSVWGYIALGRFVQEEEKNLKLARQLLEKALDIDPASAHAKKFLDEMD